MLAEASREEADAFVARGISNVSRIRPEIDREPLWHVLGYREKLFAPRPDEGPSSCSVTVPGGGAAASIDGINATSNRTPQQTLAGESSLR